MRTPKALRFIALGYLAALLVLPNLLPAIVTGAGLAFARALGEFGSVVLISGNLPFETEVASVFIFGRIEQDDPVGASAVSVVLLVVSLILLAGLGRIGRGTHANA